MTTQTLTPNANVDVNNWGPYGGPGSVWAAVADTSDGTGLHRSKMSADEKGAFLKANGEDAYRALPA